jgi:hypothetical protein
VLWEGELFESREAAGGTAVLAAICTPVREEPAGIANGIAKIQGAIQRALHG